jgi:hypothetical protein
VLSATQLESAQSSDASLLYEWRFLLPFREFIRFFPINRYAAKRSTIGIRQRYQPVLVFAAPILAVARNSAVEHDALLAAEPWY